MTLNTKNTTRIRQTKHTEAVAEATTRAEVSAEALEAAATSETITASAEAEAETETKATADKRSALYVENQDAS
jgi:hypothetical protein